MIKYAIVVGCTAMMLGCGSTAKNEISCQAENWHAAGKEAAHKGKSVRVFDNVVDQCGNTLASTAKVQFIQGYTEGLTEYCSYDTGYQMGAANMKTDNICPIELRNEFNKGYHVGNVQYRERMHDIEKIKNDTEKMPYAQKQESLDPVKRREGPEK